MQIFSFSIFMIFINISRNVNLSTIIILSLTIYA